MDRVFLYFAHLLDSVNQTTDKVVESSRDSVIDFTSDFPDLLSGNVFIFIDDVKIISVCTNLACQT